MLLPDRLSLRTVRLDYWRSLTKFGSGKRDWYTSFVILAVPFGIGMASIWAGFVLTEPTAILPAVGLLAGVLLAAAGQIVTMRSRIADSLTLAADERVTKFLRETMSGTILAAVAALVDALLLGVLASVLTKEHRWWHILLTALILAVTAYVAIMFISTARRLYATYLEVFEGGSPLPKRPQKPRPEPFYPESVDLSKHE